MARVDKTESAVGVVRGTNAADWAEADFNKIIGVGLNADGLTVRGGGQTGIIGVVIPDRTNRKAGARSDIFVLAEIILDEDETLAAATVLYSTPTGDIVTDAAAGANTRVGYTIEGDRVAVRL